MSTKPSLSKRSSHTLKTLIAVLLTGLSVAAYSRAAVPGDLLLSLRQRTETSLGSGQYIITCKKEAWNPLHTALIVCDMWDTHHCNGAAARTAELAPAFNRVVQKARNMGIQIIHAPSGTTDFYADHPARHRAQQIKRATNLPQGIDKWCHWINETEQEIGYPIDHSDGGCDCQPHCVQAKKGYPWTRQIASIEIRKPDVISDSGVEIWSLLEQRGIKNVLIAGVHTNMCVMGRPFGLRNMARFGKRVALIRDLTDTMYNSRQAPYVNHFTGTDLIVEHIEKYVCPTVTSTAFTDAAPFRFKEDTRPHLVILSAEGEYGAVESMPQLSHTLQMHHGLSCEILQGVPQRKGAGRHDIAGLESLVHADLVIVFARRRAFPAEQMEYLRQYLQRGGPLIGLRTASHAFDARGEGPKGHAEWPQFDHDVLGGNYHGHYGSGPLTTVTHAPTGAAHPILKDVTLPFTSNSSLYKNNPIAHSARTLLTGTIPSESPEPVAWTHCYGASRIFYTSLGGLGDFKNPEFRKLLINAVFWALDKNK